jgi:hypothetical protein
VEARRDVMRRRGVWSARGEEGPSQGTDPGATDVGDMLRGNRGGQGPAHGPRWGGLLSRLLWARPSEQCLFRIKSNSFKRDLN